jgi:DivIVA domain-containing protein
MLVLTIVVVAGVAAVAGGLVGGGLAEPASAVPARSLPDGPLTGPDVASLRFVQGFRGYRMDQVDAAMDQLAAELDRLHGLLAEDSQRRAAMRAEDPAGWSHLPRSQASDPQTSGSPPTLSQPTLSPPTLSQPSVSRPSVQERE